MHPKSAETTLVQLHEYEILNGRTRTCLSLYDLTGEAYQSVVDTISIVDRIMEMVQFNPEEIDAQDTHIKTIVLPFDHVDATYVDLG